MSQVSGPIPRWLKDECLHLSGGSRRGICPISSLNLYMKIPGIADGTGLKGEMLMLKTILA